MSMKESSDWPPAPAEPGTHPHENQPGVQSSDLFDGELFGDELIDIYNAAVGAVETSQGHPPSEELPTLPSQPGTTASSTNEREKIDNLHPGARVAETAARLDGSFGPLQHPSSLNDLTTLLTPSAPLEKQPQIAPAGTTISAEQVPAPFAPNAGVTAHTAQPVAPGAVPTGVVDTVAAKRKAQTPLAPNTAKRPAPAVATVPNPALASYPHPGAPPTSVVATEPKEELLQPPPNPVERGPSPAIPENPVPTDATANQEADANNAVVPEFAVSAPKPSQAPTATEADFKTVAQAAVSSLIMSTKNGEVPTGKPEGQGINTSTAHIKALTGSNWVAACSGAGTAAVAAGTGAAAAQNDSKANNRSKRQNLSADERARQNRDRNREHARNTRLRKKAYVEELKRTLTELVAQRDKAEADKRQAAQREAEQREVRFRVIEEFLNLRGRNETNPSSWGAILDSNFVLTVPSTDFRAMVNGGAGDAKESGGVELEKVYSGVHDTMNESNNFALFLQSIGGDSESSQYAPIGFVYNCDRSNFFMDVLDWSAGTVGVTKRGAPKEITMRGSVRASFCPASNKLTSASVMFDSGAVLSQLQEFLTISGSTSTADAQAAHRADAILDSLQMPHINSGVTPVIVPGESSDEGH